MIYGCGQTVEEATIDHDRHLLAVLSRAREVNMKFNKKFRFGLKEVKYMGHLLTNQGLKPDPEKVMALKEMPKPVDKAGITRFLGFVNYMSKFAPELANVAEPLRRLTDKDVPWTWDSIHDGAFNNIVQSVCSVPILENLIQMMK